MDNKKQSVGNSRPRRTQRRQPKKDSRAKRVNFDNERVSKFDRDEQAAMRRAAGMKDDRSNDIIWYAKNAELLKAAASLPFSTSVGLRTEFSKPQAVPGVMALTWSPTVGGLSGRPINQAANSIYSYVVHANSRNYSYDPADQMKMIIAGMNVFCAIAMGIRAYGIMRNYSQRDFYTPSALMTAMRFNYTDWRNNLSKAWFGINELIARASQIWIPTTMPVLNRWFWLNSNVYRDGDSAKSQYYIFTQIYFYKYVIGSTAKETVLSAVSTQEMTVDSYLQFVNELIQPLIESQDRGIIFGDILKAYGSENIFALNPIPADYTITPAYDREVLTQIENATVFNARPASLSEDPTSGELVELWNQQTSMDASRQAPNVQVLNFHQPTDPTPEQIMVATRLKAAGTYVQQFTGNPNAVYVLQPDTCGTEIVTNAISYYYSWEGSGSPTLRQLSLPLLGSSEAAINNTVMFHWTSFDWCPWIYIVTEAAEPTMANVSLVYDTIEGIGDWDNYTFIDVSVLSKMHTTALYSEFGVPAI